MISSTQLPNPDPMYAVMQRILGYRPVAIQCEMIPPEAGQDIVELETAGSKVVLRGSTIPALGFAFHWYLTRYAGGQFSHAGDGVRRELSWPDIPQKVRLSTPYRYRYFFNYCTFSYSMAWWGWQEWERELDWMAVHGVNLALATVGAEAVWPAVLRRYGFDEQEILAFLPGPAYMPWFHMGNLEGLGGPVSPAWLERQVALGRRILDRMGELGIAPVLQGFYGMVPRRLAEKRAGVRLISTGNWGGAERPALLDPTDPFFAEVAAVYYEEQQRLFGPARFYGGDPFHEGGDPGRLDITAGGRAIQVAMQAAYPGSIWVLQGWQENPSAALLHGTDPRHTLVIDLFCETVSLCEQRGGFGKTPWIWGVIQNFGGNTPSHGKLGRIAREAELARTRSHPPAPCGLGGLMEGFGSNPVNWELLFELAWLPGPVDVQEWVVAYARARYGRPNAPAEAAWRMFSETIYAQPGATESLVCARPALGLDRVTTWGSAQLYYDPRRLEEAVSLLLQAAKALGGIDPYHYDLVDITRQALANRGQVLYPQIETAFRERKTEEFEGLCGQFLGLIDDMEKLLATRPEFLLGRWLAAARAAADPEHQDRFEQNARMLLTTWGGRAVAESGPRDYAYREWAGLMSTFYEPRWEIFFDALRSEMGGETRRDFDWFVWEWNWVNHRDPFPSEPAGDSIEIARQLHEKYAFHAA